MEVVLCKPWKYSVAVLLLDSRSMIACANTVWSLPSRDQSGVASASIKPLFVAWQRVVAALDVNCFNVSTCILMIYRNIDCDITGQ